MARSSHRPLVFLCTVAVNLTAKYGLAVHQADANNIFLKRKMDRNIYLPLYNRIINEEDTYLFVIEIEFLYGLDSHRFSDPSPLT